MALGEEPGEAGSTAWSCCDPDVRTILQLGLTGDVVVDSSPSVKERGRGGADDGAVALGLGAAVLLRGAEERGAEEETTVQRGGLEEATRFVVIGLGLFVRPG